ncbi:hypothetical protein B0J17DRAFT_80625 [Rhizoctonia solani]|nr:hypothetical protein B0J17DRAFT_80625 [Rhizoctonia solani]
MWYPTNVGQRNGPITYKRRKPTVVKSPSFPKLTGPYIRQHNAAESSSRRDPYREPAKRQAEADREDEGSTKEADTDTETEEESPPTLPSNSRADGRHSPLKSKSEPLIKPRTRGVTRNAPSEPELQRAASVPFERPHATSAARTRELPTRNRSTQREIKKQITLGLPGLPEHYPKWPRVVIREETLRRRSDTKSRTSSVANTSRKSAGETSVSGPSEPPNTQAAPATEAKVPRPVSPAPTPAPPVPPPNPSPDGPRRSSLAKSTGGSSGRPSSAKSVSFRVEGVDDFDEYQNDYVPVPPDDGEADRERIMSSIEPENDPLSREPTQVRSYFVHLICFCAELG